MATTGGCLCGQVRYEIPSETPIAARACWCRVCQYLGAGSGTVNLVLAREGMTLTGQIKRHTLQADSGTVMHRSFCPECGTPLFSEAESRPQAIVVRGGTLDDPERAKPQMTIWTRMAPSWACFDPALPQNEGQPAPPPPAR